MCKAMEDMRNTARDEGRISGLNEKAIKVAKKMLEMGKYTFEEIMAVSELSLEQIKELAGV